MDKIILRNANVVKEVISEEAALALEKKGFVRDGAVPDTGSGKLEMLQKQNTAAEKKNNRGGVGCDKGTGKLAGGRIDGQLETG